MRWKNCGGNPKATRSRSVWDFLEAGLVYAVLGADIVIILGAVWINLTGRDPYFPPDEEPRHEKR